MITIQRVKTGSTIAGFQISGHAGYAVVQDDRRDRRAVVVRGENARHAAVEERGVA